MPDIFGADIAGIVAEAFDGLLFDQVLIKIASSRDPSDSTNTIKVETRHDCQGFVDNFAKENAKNGTTITDAKIVIIGDTLPAGIVPEPKDHIEAESRTFVIQDAGVVRDPAGATYECRSR